MTTRICAVPCAREHHIRTADGDIGHLQGFFLDDETLGIRYVIANTSNWWLGHEVPIARERIKEVSWSGASITVDPEKR